MTIYSSPLKSAKLPGDHLYNPHHPENIYRYYKHFTQ